METITFKTEKEFFRAIHSSNDFMEYEEEKLTNFDTEKGFVDVEVFLERISDGKKFRAEYTRGGQGNRWVDAPFVFQERIEEVKVNPFTSQEILDEMDADMENSGMAQGEIESNLNHWKNKYLIVRR